MAKRLKQTTISNPVAERQRKMLVSFGTQENEAKPVSISLSDIPSITEHTSTMIDNNTSILNLFPEYEFSMAILTGMIKSPNSVGRAHLKYSFSDRYMPTTVRNMILTTIVEYIKDNYNMEKMLTPILTETLFTKGSYVEIIIPDKGLEDFIISNTTNLKVGKESLEHVSKYGLSSLDEAELGIEFGDEIGLLSLHAKAVEHKVNVGLESANMFRKVTANKTAGGVLTIGTIKDYNVDALAGKPFVLKADTRSVIPICSKNDPSSHLGYFVAVDASGALVYNQESISTSTLDSNLKKLSQLLNKTNANIAQSEKEAPVLSNMYELYSEKVEEKITAALELTPLAAIGKVEETSWIHSIMFSRTLRNLETRLIYIDASSVQYYAREYRANGTGKSLLEKIMIISSLRAIMLFAGVQAGVKNSVPQTKVDVTLDPKDPKPKQTMQLAKDAIMKAKADTLPVGGINASDLSGWLSRAGVHINYKHPSLPDMEVEINEHSSDLSGPDTELMEELKDSAIRGLGLPPELIANMNDAEFATAILASNAILDGVVEGHQDSFNPQITSHIKKLLLSDGNITKRIHAALLADMTKIKKHLPIVYKDSIKDNKTSNEDIATAMVDIIIGDITVELPARTVSDPDGTMEAYEAYVNKLDELIEVFFSSEAFPEEYAGMLSDKADDIKDMLRATLIRKWVADNNFSPALVDAFNIDADGNAIYDLLSDFNTHMSNIGTVFKTFLKENTKQKKQLDKKITKHEEGEEDPEETPEPTNDAPEETPEEDANTPEETPGEEKGTPEEEEKKVDDTLDF